MASVGIGTGKLGAGRAGGAVDELDDDPDVGEDAAL